MDLLEAIQKFYPHLSQEKKEVIEYFLGEDKIDVPFPFPIGMHLYLDYKYSIRYFPIRYSYEFLMRKNITKDLSIELFVGEVIYRRYFVKERTVSEQEFVLQIVQQSKLHGFI